MKKIFAVVLSVLIASSVFAANIDYVYKNSVSSVSFDEKQNKGTVFTDDDKNIYFVKSSNDEVTIFDRFYTRKTVKEGTELKPRKPVYQVGALATTSLAGAEFSFTLKNVYPLQPCFFAGLSFDTNAIIMAGVKLACPLSNLVNSRFTLLEDGSLDGYALGGVAQGFEISFLYGITYKHVIGHFYWGIGLSWMLIPDLAVKNTMYSISLGGWF